MIACLFAQEGLCSAISRIDDEMVEAARGRARTALSFESRRAAGASEPGTDSLKSSWHTLGPSGPLQNAGATVWGPLIDCKQRHNATQNH